MARIHKFSKTGYEGSPSEQLANGEDSKACMYADANGPSERGETDRLIL
jgi:hypothetical protein